MVQTVIVIWHAIAVPKPINSACPFRNEGEPIECREHQNRLTMLTAERSGNRVGMGLPLRLGVRCRLWGVCSLCNPQNVENKGKSQLLPKVCGTGTMVLMPVPSTQTVRPFAASAPWCAAVSIPRAPPLTTVTPT